MNFLRLSAIAFLISMMGGTDSFCAEVFEKSQQLPDGRIIFVPADAAIENSADRAKRESAGAVTLSGGESAVWEYKPTRWGKYDAELTLASKGAEVELRIEIPGNPISVRTKVKDPGHLLIRNFHLAKSEPFSVRVRVEKGTASIRSLLLRPAAEGKPIVQTEEQIALHARDAITHSVMMRYEPATNKNCLGYWTNPNDAAEWKFSVARPGSYQVELWQGCGKGNGGSDVGVQVFGKNGLMKEFAFVVEDTGHFQNFIPRKLGFVNFPEAGEYALFVRPKQKQAAAVMDIRQILLLPASLDKPTSSNEPNPALKTLLEARRVVFLGDSITYAGEYVEFIETFVRLQYPGSDVEFIDLGLPSETVSGLSEPGHAGGSFPRPDLHERLGRVLEKAKPDLILACYGMNDGIYYPPSEAAFEKFKTGMRRLRERATAMGAKVVHITPPVFDPVPLAGRTLPAGRTEYRQPYEGYNTVLDQFSEWLVQQRGGGWEVIDAHSPMNQFLAEKRKTNPGFLLASDGVHANAQGHWLIAREILRHLGASNDLIAGETSAALLSLRPHGEEVLKLVQQRQRITKDAWLTYVGHLRPGMNEGKPLSSAEQEAAELDQKIESLTRAKALHQGAAGSGTDGGTVRLSRFDIDVTPPIGSHMAYDPVTNDWDLSLRARGVVLQTGSKKFVLCAIDWIGIANEGYDEFRAALARGAGTTSDRVALHALHQHDAPDCDFGAERILKEAGMDARQFEGSFQRDVMARLESAVRQSLASAQPITHLGLGEARVEKVASNRRIFGPEGKVRAVRYTACPDPLLREEPEGTIDPVVSLVSFWNGEKPVVVLSYYATHPQSYYRTGIPNPDFPGVARFARQLAVPPALHIHFNGAGGNIGAGKYNDGSQTNRLTLSERLADGMKRAWESTKREPLDPNSVNWSVEAVALPPSQHLSREILEAEVKNRDPKLTSEGRASRLAWLRRCEAGHKIEISCLKLNRARMVHMPGELFVEYQLAAKAERPDLFVAMAAYGDYGPWYIGTSTAYEEGGYETEPRSSNVAPEVEKVLLGAIRKVLKD